MLVRRVFQFFYAIMALLVVGVVAAVVAPNFIDWQQYKQPAIDAAQKATGYKIEITGPLSIKTLPSPRLTLSDIRVQNNAETLLVLKSADIRVALWPLLARQIEVTQVDLIDPVATLAIKSDGQPNWMNVMLADTLAAEKTAPKNAASSETEPTAAPQIAVRQISVQNGRMTYRDARKDTSFKAEKLNVALQADTLSGPFTAKGTVVVDGRNIAFDLAAEAIPGSVREVPVKLALSLPDQKAELSYAGTVRSLSPIALTGDVKVKAESFPALLGRAGDGALDLRTRLVAQERAITLENFTGSFAGVMLKGTGALTNLAEGARPEVNLDVAVDNALPLDRILGEVAVTPTLKKNEKANASTTQMQENDGFLPAKLMESFPFDGKISIKAPGLVYREATTGAVSLKATMGAAQAQVQTKIAGLPGKGTLDLVADITANPAKITGQMALAAQDPAVLLVDWLELAADQRDRLAKMQDMSFQTEFAVLPRTAAVADGTLRWSGGAVQFSGDYKKLDAIDAAFNVSSADAGRALVSLGIILPDLPKPLGQAGVDVKLRGTPDKLHTKAALNVYGGTITLDGDVLSAFVSPKLAGVAVRLQYPNLVQVLQLGEPTYQGTSALQKPLDLAAKVTTTDKVYTLAGLKGQAGPVRLNGDLKLDLTARPALSGALALGDLPVSDFLGVQKTAAATNGNSGAGKAAPTSSMRWSKQPFATSWMKDMDIALNLKAQSLTYNLWKLQNPALDVDLNGGVLQVPALSASLFGGKISGRGKFSGGTNGQLALAANMQNVNARELTNALAGRASNRVAGDVSFMMDVTGRGASPDQLINTLSGKGTSSGKNLTISGIDLAKISDTATGSYKPIDRALVLQSALSSGQTSFETHDGAFTLNNGIVQIDRNIFDSPEYSFTTAGALNLPLWVMDTKHSIVIKQPPETPPFSFTLKGSIDKPVQNILGGAIENYLSSKLQERATKLIDKKFGKKLDDLGLGGLLGPKPETPSESSETAPPAEQPVAPREVTPEDAVRGVLEGLIR